MIDKLPKICSYVCCNSHNYTPSGQKWNHANGSLWFRKEVRPDVPVFDRIFCLNLFRIWYEINSSEAGVELLIWNFILSVHQDNWAVHGNIRPGLSLSRFLHSQFSCDKIKLAALVTIFTMISSGIYIMRECIRALIPEWLKGPHNKEKSDEVLAKEN